MRKLISCLLSFLLATSFIPTTAFADPSPRASDVPQLAITYQGYEEASAHTSGRYLFTVNASAAALQDIAVAYSTFQGTTEGEWYVPVRSTATIAQGRQSVDIAIEAAQPSDDSLDRYVAAAGASKYFGVALLAASGAEINSESKAATADVSARASVVDRQRRRAGPQGFFRTGFRRSH